MHYAERELFRYTKGSVREHNLLKNQFVHTKFLLNHKKGRTSACPLLLTIYKQIPAGPGFTGYLWTNRAHRAAVVAAVVPVVVAAAEDQVVSAAAEAAIQRTRPIVAGAPAENIRTVAVARSGQEDAVAVGAGYAVTGYAMKGSPSPSTVVA